MNAKVRNFGVCRRRDCTHHAAPGAPNCCNYMLDMMRHFGKPDDDFTAVQGYSCRRGCPAGEKCTKYRSKYETTEEEMEQMSEERHVSMKLPPNVKLPPKTEIIPVKPDDAKLQELYDQGLSDYHIAEQIGYSRETVSTWRRDKGLKMHRACKPRKLDETILREMYFAGAHDQEIAKALGVGAQAIYKYRRANHMPANKPEAGPKEKRPKTEPSEQAKRKNAKRAAGGDSPGRQERIERILELNAQNEICPAIAEEVGVNVKTVYKYLALNGREAVESRRPGRSAMMMRAEMVELYYKWKTPADIAQETGFGILTVLYNLKKAGVINAEGERDNERAQTSTGI